MPNVFVFGGCNGSGKTTFATAFLSAFPTIEFVNADAIAAELNPLDVEAVAIEASRLMLQRINNLSQQGVDFAFETTLAARSFSRFLKGCKTKGYKINLIYVWLETADLAVSRVFQRVQSGGHSIPEETVRRRYKRGKSNFTNLYLPLADRWIVYDNSRERAKIAEKPLDLSTIVYRETTWQKIINS